MPVRYVPEVAMVSILNQLPPNPRPFWLTAFFLVLCGWLIVGAGGFIWLSFAGRLVAPPLVGTACIDEKLNFLRESQLSTIRIMAVGSSATWRNLDMTVFGLDPSEAINAAPCLLYVNQTDF